MANQRRNFRFPRPPRGEIEGLRVALAENQRALEAWIAATQDVVVEDGEQVVFLDGDGDDEWYLVLGASDHLELHDAGGNLRTRWFTTGGFTVYDGSGNAAIVYDASNSRLSLRPSGGSELVRITDVGFLADYSSSVVPLQRYLAMAAHTFSAANTWEVMGTEVISANTSTSYTLTAHGAVGFRNIASTTHRNARARLAYSTDGGSSWTAGQNFRVDALASDEHARASVPVVVGFEDVTPTGDIHVRCEVYASHTEVVGENGAFALTLTGEF